MTSARWWRRPTAASSTRARSRPRRATKALRIGIFLSIFDVHVNRAPVAGRVLAKKRGGEKYLAAFNKAAERHNVRCAMTLETAGGAEVDVVQITGLIARRIVCQPAVGEWLARGVRYGMIRFGSRTDVVLPVGSEARVAVGDRVKRRQQRDRGAGGRCGMTAPRRRRRHPAAEGPSPSSPPPPG